MSELIKAHEITKVYPRGAETVHALGGVSFTINKKEFTAITGPSGSGKTTLLHLVGGLDKPTAGEIYLDGISLNRLYPHELDRIRREKIGFVFQQFYLLPGLTAAENVVLPLLFKGSGKDDKMVTEALVAVGMEHRRQHRPHELSGGEMQRVAIARALVNRPELLLADEPTANLDQANSAVIFRLFQELTQRGLTVVVVTHNPALAQAAARRICLEDGNIVSDS